MEEKIECLFEEMHIGARNNKIVCGLVNQESIFDKDCKFIVNNNGYSANACTGIRFEKCIMFAIPSSESIITLIQNLIVLDISNSKLSKIKSGDLQGFNCLRDLYVINCDIECLPKDLFKFTPLIEIVYFQHNLIKYIDEGILDNLLYLKIFNLYGNVNISSNYIFNGTGEVFEELKNDIKNKCSRIDLKEVSDLKETCKMLVNKLETLSRRFEATKDFTIKINSKHFMVHSAVAKTHSVYISQYIANYPNSGVLNLDEKDVSEASLQEIINFMNEGIQPSETANMVKLHRASVFLEIEALKNITFVRQGRR